jgi:FtsK/SpoIIIE family
MKGKKSGRKEKAMPVLSPTRLEELRAMLYEEYLTTPEWQATRKRILKRDNYTCQGCSATGVVLNVHHWTYERLGAEDNDDLTAVCQKCHDEIHGIVPTLPFLHKVGIFGGVATIGTIGLEGILQAPLPAEIGLLVGAYFLAKSSPALYGMLKNKISPEVFAWLGIHAKEKQIGQYSFFERFALGRGLNGRQSEKAEEVGGVVIDEEAIVAHMSEYDLFASAIKATNQPKIQRLTIGSIVRHTTANSYQIFIGRSMTKDKNPAVKIGFRKRHIKIIGASQYGKSSMAAAFLDIVVRTHDPEHVLVALLDLEDRTSKLFASIPHRAMVTLDGKQIVLHARSKEQVLEHLGYLLRIMDERYKLSVREVEQEPIILIYLEEFIALKDHFKTLAKAGGQAKKDYEDLVHRIKELARRGLKVYMQFLMCAQVDYRDDDLQEALINVNSGMSFSVRATAAIAAGFKQTELINRNITNNMVGQAVVEMPDCQDLVLAPDYNLEARLRVLETERGPIQGRSHVSMVSSATSVPTSQATSVPTSELPEEKHTESLDEATIKPNMPDKRLKSEDVHIDTLIQAWNTGINSVSKMENFFKMSHGEAYKVYNRVKAQRGEPVEEQE